MKHLSLASICLTLCLGMAPAGALAQGPGHTHYAKNPEADQASATGAKAPRLQNVGPRVFRVTTANERAQLFVSQGVNLAYGFNHPEAGRAFAEAARLDPECAIAYWGQALVLGPNINAPMDPNEEPKALVLVKKAVALAPKASERERDYIAALATRYTGKPEDRARADRAYVEAMRALAKKYPDDLDAVTMFAESVMDLRPWDYWTRDGRPYPGTDEAVTAIASVIDRDPNHIGALHYWIHLMEGPSPQRAEAAADRLLPLAPAAGHLVHMPAHIYFRVGRYADSVKANQLAMAADEDYVSQCHAQGIYPLVYYPHNIHFLWTSATMAGQSQMAIKASRDLAAAIPREALEKLPFLQVFLLPQYYSLVRFGKWDEILKMPAPSYDSPLTRGVWHYARGIALTNAGQLAEADKERAALHESLANPELRTVLVSNYNSEFDVLRIADEVLAGEMAAKKGDFDAAVAHLDTAVRYHDALVYTEPDDWHYPARQSLGAVLLEAGRAAEAEVVYWEDLKRNPENGWSLFGLAKALRAQKKDTEATLVEARFAKAWANADVTLAASRF